MECDGASTRMWLFGTNDSFPDRDIRAKAQLTIRLSQRVLWSLSVHKAIDVAAASLAYSMTCNNTSGIVSC